MPKAMIGVLCSAQSLTIAATSSVVRERRRRRAHAPGGRIRPCRAGRRSPPMVDSRSPSSWRSAATRLCIERIAAHGRQAAWRRPKSARSASREHYSRPRRRRNRIATNERSDHVAERRPRVSMPTDSFDRSAAVRLPFRDWVVRLIEEPRATLRLIGPQRRFREVAMALAAVTLDDKYVLDKGRVYLTGTQALVRLPMMQRQRDAAAGLNTGLLYFRLSRFAARRPRSGAVERTPVSRKQPHPLSAGDQRRARRHRGVGQPAAQSVPRRQI